MVDKALSALRFSKNATTKLTPFEAHHGREVNTVLRNLTKKPSLKNLNWKNVLQQKCLCLGENDRGEHDRISQTLKLGGEIRPSERPSVQKCTSNPR